MLVSFATFTATYDISILRNFLLTSQPVRDRVLGDDVFCRVGERCWETVTLQNRR